jgi:hypothetical protein
MVYSTMLSVTYTMQLPMAGLLVIDKKECGNKLIMAL